MGYTYLYILSVIRVDYFSRCHMPLYPVRLIASLHAPRKKTLVISFNFSLE